MNIKTTKCQFSFINGRPKSSFISIFFIGTINNTFVASRLMKKAEIQKNIASVILDVPCIRVCNMIQS